MARLIPPPQNSDQTVVPTGSADIPLTYFRLVTLAPGESITDRQKNFELLVVVLSGSVDVQVAGQSFESVGRRDSVWTGNADSIYVGTNSEVQIAAKDKPAEIAIAGGYTTENFAAFRIPPEEVESVEVGSIETHSKRNIRHILGQSANGRAGNLLVSELYAAPGCWSGYPPHKHDQENPPEETAFEEVYHYRFNPETGFGGQYHYRDGEDPACVMTQHRSTFVVDDGYHPTSTSPGHEGYIFTILVGKHQRSLIQKFDPQHEHLMAGIPGLQGMRDKFK
ncbi:5-deoxy-glucuronate isomerase [Opitutaceae bacterium]|nr:5-deoxy-glucuronate isomerase [Opitutaceae bacterium]